MIEYDQPYFLFELLYTATAIPYNCMAGLATHADNERCSINVHRNIGSCVGTAIGAVACFPLLNLFGALDDNGNLDPTNGSRGFFLTSYVMAAVCIGGCLIHYFTIKERVVPENEEEHVGILHIFKVLQPDSAIHAINAMLGWVPALFGVFMFITILFLSIDGELKKMNAEKG